MQKQPPLRRTPPAPNVPKRARQVAEGGDPIAALTPEDIEWLRSHGWDPDADLVERLISYDWR